MTSWQSGNPVAPKSKSGMLARLANAPVQAKLAARNTLDYTDAKGVRRIRLHDTDILTLRPRGGFTVDTGGWNTHTTRYRLNAFLPSPWRVHTERGRIHLRNYETQTSTVFRDTVTVSASGKVKPDVSPKAADKLAKQIDAYMSAWRKRGLPTAEESGGDPWIFTPGKVEPSVMLDWIKSRYVHRRLYSLALAYTGLSDHALAYNLHVADREGLDTRDYQRIRRYIRACLGLAA